MKEKRRHRRCIVLQDIMCYTEDNTMFKASILDMSSGGMKIATDRALNLGDIFNAELPLEKKFTPIKVKCKVVRQKPFIDKFRPNQKTGKVELGAQFLDVDNFYRNRIFSFISQLQKQKTAAAKYKQKMTDMPF